MERPDGRRPDEDFKSMVILHGKWLEIHLAESR